MARRPSSISTFKAFSAGVGVFALGSLLALGCIEGGMRALGYGAVSALAYGRASYSPDLPEVGYAGRPNIRGVQSSEGVSELALNAHGFHDVDHSLEKAPGVFRLMVVGNSYSMATQVSRAEGFVAKLGDELRQCPALSGREVETINLGVEGYTIHQQYLMFRDYGLSLSPDFVLLQTNSFVVPGDLDPLKNLSPRLVRGTDGKIAVNYSYMQTPAFRQKSSTGAMLLLAASDKSRLLQYFLQYRRISAQIAAKGNATEKPNAKEDAAATDAAAYESYRQGRDLAFHELADLVREKDIPFAVTVIPNADAGSDLPFEPEPLRREWAELAASVKAPFLDVEEEARAQVRSNGAYLHGFGAEAGSGHLNRAGNAFFGKALAARVCKLLGERQTTALTWPLRLQ